MRLSPAASRSWPVAGIPATLRIAFASVKRPGGGLSRRPAAQGLGSCQDSGEEEDGEAGAERKCLLELLATNDRGVVGRYTGHRERDLRDQVGSSDVDEVAGRERQQKRDVERVREGERKQPADEEREPEATLYASADCAFQPLLTRMPKSPSSCGTS